MTLRGGLMRTGLAAAMAAVVLGLSPAPAQAIPVPPPGGSLLTVFTYYLRDTIVGQRWLGCPGVPPASWGIQSATFTVSFTIC